MSSTSSRASALARIGFLALIGCHAAESAPAPLRVRADPNNLPFSNRAQQGYVPPVQALARHGLADRLVGYSFFSDYAKPDPPRQLIDAVARGEVDVAIAWGPLAGGAAAHAAVALEVTPIERPVGEPLPFAFSIAMGVRKTDPALLATIDAVIARHRADIDGVLDRFAIPHTRPGGPR
jgi:mxaJ protein